MTGYSSFFEQGAEIAGTLIGLLFVAISLSPYDRHPDDAPLWFRIQTTAALTTLIDALVVSLTALLPGDSVGAAAIVASVIGLSTTAGLTVLAIHRWPGRRGLRDLVVIPLLAAAYLTQFLDGIHRLTSAPGPGSLRTQAFLVIAFFLIAIARAWRLIGGRGSRLLSAVAETARRRADPAADPEPEGATQVPER